MRGDTIEQAAEVLAITTAHVRQRLKIIFDKTDAHRQSALIALLQRLAWRDRRARATGVARRWHDSCYKAR